MRVIVDLVVNHTSDQHPWFRAARSSPHVAVPRLVRLARRAAAGRRAERRLPRPGDERLDATTRRPAQYYLHRFYKHQPDLNVANPAVRDEIAKVMGFWLAARASPASASTPCRSSSRPRGVDERRRDLPDPHEYLRDLRAFLGRRSGDAILLGEVNLPHEEQLRFFGGEDGDELTMLFDFIGMQKLYLSLARGDAAPARRGAAAPGRRCRRTASGRRSCATTTS